MTEGVSKMEYRGFEYIIERCAEVIARARTDHWAGHRR